MNGVQTGIVSWSMKPCTIAPYPGEFIYLKSLLSSNELFIL